MGRCWPLVVLRRRTACVGSSGRGFEEGGPLWSAGSVPVWGCWSYWGGGAVAAAVGSSGRVKEWLAAGTNGPSGAHEAVDLIAAVVPRRPQRRRHTPV